MAEQIVYLKAERNTEVQEEDVFLRDVSSVYCADKQTEAKVKSIKIHKFHKNQAKKCVISILKVIEMIEKTCPGVTVENLGEADFLLEIVNVNRHKSLGQGLRIAVVAAVSFFGTAFTIMAFHNDIGIRDVFAEIYRIVMGQESGGFTVLEAAYSLGLAIGIIVFFNHIGGRRITKDPTPIEVAMRQYEEEVDKALIATADREGKEKDAS